ncbi:Alginate export [Nitrosomonas marina]|uniref:Alginate export n=1 Tax=Nitrosomonas marina TaxID=917 RepID=A0A1I0DXB5_9PROT|nr:alginate export family protein [Nitrosomonas marina]SET37185.1 Alginate export [Nitrosomonas marina]
MNTYRRSDTRLLIIFLILNGASILFTSRALQAQWLLNDLLPQGFSIQVNHRSRYEFMDDEFRANQTGQTDVIVFRTLVHGRVQLPAGFTVGGEFQDSRTTVDSNALLNTTIVNSAELLRAYLEYTRPDILGGNLTMQAGRMTLDVGSRRFVSRNRFRNTINSFTGVDINWHGSAGHNGLHLRGFWTLPGIRLPDTPALLHQNRTVFDDEGFDLQLWGVFAATNLSRYGRGELFVFGLHEKNSPGSPTQNRQLFTPGFRIFKTPAASNIDYEFESAFQIGRSRASPADYRTMDHFAHFHHLEIGFTLPMAWSPRITALYDFASGDENPDDGNNGRFDTLFGSRRFDFGPTGIFGALARTNMHSPGLRLQFIPNARLNAAVDYRALWLASDRDAWGNSGVRDESGRSGSFVGSQIDTRMQWQLLPGNMDIELGYTHIFSGEFMHQAPNAGHRDDINYFYTQATVSF